VICYGRVELPVFPVEWPFPCESVASLDRSLALCPRRVSYKEAWFAPILVTLIGDPP